jgi:Domain of unknown function (DUF4872)/Butirosin biosynthesis protein H, N-terminal
MTTVPYSWFGGRHGEAASLRGLLAQAGVKNPASGEPLSEPLCFGIAGGIGAGYSFCPSVIRYGCGSGVSIVGRHFSYATSGVWYQAACERLGLKTRLTETASSKKAYQNLVEELCAGRPTAVWCARSMLPFMHDIETSCGLWMHSFVVYGVDADQGEAYGSDRAPTPLTISLEDLAAARAGVCSHKNRTLSIDPPAKPLTAATLKAAIQSGIRACAGELIQGKMKNFSLPGLETLAKMIANDNNKDGWLKVFQNGLLYYALRDVFDSIETAGTGGGLFRSLYADFLDEAATIRKRPSLKTLADDYRHLATGWTQLAESALPTEIKPFKETQHLLVKKRDLFETKGAKADKQIAEIRARLHVLGKHTKANFPLGDAQARELLGSLRDRIIALHRVETELAARLAAEGK